ncbi:helix-turn-helix domain-containing protein [Mammaliicoccus sciuri]|uniref:helix-turn-helix domain-containing protein n=1 Tax=Mammaliicoccus sciuri TaxID=1296 RepID=UPI000CCFF058|nr:helix-turn-helix domain-containing protein [Mammaliicoccus sciuri]PNZ30022.1 DNA replication protein DnaD [Mammaliicoccus sciuri]
MLERPSYYSIITANVRYDNRLTDSEKLLFAEITSLSNKFGYCTATNRYFAELYEVTKVTISRRISKLKEYGYVKIEIVREGNEIKQRKLYPITIPIAPINTNDNTGINNDDNTPINTNDNTGINTNVKDNNTSNNNTSNNNTRHNIDDIFKLISLKIPNAFIGITNGYVVDQIKHAITDIGDNAYEVVEVALNLTTAKARKGSELNFLKSVLNDWAKNNINTKDLALDKVTPKKSKSQLTDEVFEQYKQKLDNESNNNIKKESSIFDEIYDDYKKMNGGH